MDKIRPFQQTNRVKNHTYIIYFLGSKNYKDVGRNPPPQILFLNKNFKQIIDGGRFFFFEGKLSPPPQKRGKKIFSESVQQ